MMLHHLAPEDGFYWGIHNNEAMTFCSIESPVIRESRIITRMVDVDILVWRRGIIFVLTCDPKWILLDTIHSGVGALGNSWPFSEVPKRNKTGGPDGLAFEASWFYSINLWIQRSPASEPMRWSVEYLVKNFFLPKNPVTRYLSKMRSRKARARNVQW